ncbi:MAG: alpha-hydroxy-acid oxidizing protein [Spirochaetaceae bacterium]|jgi:isopentenyl diphosphate isomerase/L-lactate dehydrogenase-like FMN-dependent dehydrogenase|nr:alpha-hydroxy-acid oxidizing protein [Spirochaetaceae bacterium]
MEEPVSRANSELITREYFDSLQVELRTIDAVRASTKTELFGAALSTPVMVTALSGLDKTYPKGMVETARGAAAAGALMWSGIGSEEELEALIGTGAKLIKIIKPYADTDLIFKKIAHAKKAGVLALGMDTDFVFGGRRHRGFAMEYPVSPKTLDDIKSFVKAAEVPFILKGILSERDAEKALEAGAGGIVVSHHQGIIDSAVPPVKILPRIVRVINKRIPIFVDCGIAKGIDAFKALALGAKAVGTGKAVMRGLAAEGAAGVQKVLETMTEELRWVMNLTGSPDPDHIDPELIWK